MPKNFSRYCPVKHPSTYAVHPSKNQWIWEIFMQDLFLSSFLWYICVCNQILFVIQCCLIFYCFLVDGILISIFISCISYAFIFDWFLVDSIFVFCWSIMQGFIAFSALPTILKVKWYWYRLFTLPKPNSIINKLFSIKYFVGISFVIRALYNSRQIDLYCTKQFSKHQFLL